ncbi:MAG: rRNA maturation RNase YbeY [Proteobacteria bacterium]|nr:rRNA maturation RNase YbeY [Pseudomonadota bacterium]
MDNLIEVVVADSLWNRFDLDEMADHAFHAVATKLKLVDGPYELSVLACDDARIAVLNAEFRGKEVPTNVLSWPGYDLGADVEGGQPDALPLADIGDPFVNVGDIAIAYQTCMQEADKAGIEPRHHVTHLLIHGILHLLGYDHETEMDAEMMETLEIDLLDSMGIGNPYKEV